MILDLEIHKYITIKYIYIYVNIYKDLLETVSFYNNVADYRIYMQKSSSPV